VGKKSLFRWMFDRTGSGKLLAKLTERKAPEPERISSEFIKYATRQFKASLVNAFNKYWKRSQSAFKNQ